MQKGVLLIVPALFLSACLPPHGSVGIISPAETSCEFALGDEDIAEIKNEIFAEVLYRPRPSREREMIRNLRAEAVKEGDR